MALANLLTNFGQTYTDSAYDYSSAYGTSEELTAGDAAAAAGVGLGLMLFYFVIIAFFVVCMWKIFVKAGKPGWASIVPIYNSIVLLEIVGRPVWWIALMLIPFVNIVASVIIAIDLAKAFGKDSGFGILLVLLPFIGYPMLAFGDAKYVGPVASGTGMAPASGAAASPFTQPVAPAAATPQMPQQPAQGQRPPQGPLVQ